MFRPPRAAAALAGKKIKRNIEEILLSSDVKENYHRADLAVRIATKKGKGIPSCLASTNTATTTAATTTLKTDETMMQEEQQPRTKKAKTKTSTTVPTKSDKTPPPPAPVVHSKKTVVIIDAVENGPIMGRSTALLVNKTMEFAELLSPLYPQVIDFAKRVRRHG